MREVMLKREPKNKWDSNAVAVVRCNTCADRIQRKLERSDSTPVQHPNEFNSDLEEVVGHIPMLMAPLVTKVLK